jgi:hypothetical protein
VPNYLSLILFLLLWNFSQKVYSDNPKERYIKILPGYGYMQGRDEGMSPLIYTGSHFAGTTGFEKRNQKAVNRLDMTALIGNLQNATQPDGYNSKVWSLRMQADYQYLRFVKSWKEEKLKVYVGGVWNNLANVRNHSRYGNNSLNYEFSSSLGASGMVKYDFNFKNRKLAVYSTLDLPLIAFNVRPSFASSIPDGFIAQEKRNLGAFFQSGKIQSYGGFFRFRIANAFEYVIFNDNRLMLGYTWDYYGIQKYYKVQMASHQLLIGLIFRF